MGPNEYMIKALTTEADQETIRQRVYALGAQATRLDNAARGLADEAGELSSHVKAYLEYGKPLDREGVLEECGDAVWRVCQALAAVGYTLDDALRANINKLQQARYKKGYSDAAADPDARDLAAERGALTTIRPTPPIASRPAASPEKYRPTRAQVLAAQKTISGCCNRHADNMACDCLANALPDNTGPEGDS